MLVALATVMMTQYDSPPRSLPDNMMSVHVRCTICFCHPLLETVDSEAWSLAMHARVRLAFLNAHLTHMCSTRSQATGNDEYFNSAELARGSSSDAWIVCCSHNRPI